MLLKGLSPQSVWLEWMRNQPVEVSDGAEVSKLLRSL